MILTPEDIAAIKRVRDYSWDKEWEDAQEQYAENGGVLGEHVFADLVRLDNLVMGYDKKPEDYLSMPDPDDDPY